MDLDAAARAFREFAAIVQALRTPGTGCPWDLEQDHRTLRPYLIEETYEVLDAIDGGDDRALAEELGDLLLQVVLHAQLAADRGAFTIADVIQGIAAKMVRRHPHVFGSTQVSGSAEVVRNWQAIKAAEHGGAEHGGSGDEFDRVPASLPALLRASRLAQSTPSCTGNRSRKTRPTRICGRWRWQPTHVPGWRKRWARYFLDSARPHAGLGSAPRMGCASRTGVSWK